MYLMIINKKLVGQLSDGTPVMADLTDKQEEYIRNNLITIKEDWIKQNLFPDTVEREAKVAETKEILRTLEGHPEFFYKNGSLYKEGINLSIPELLAKEFAKSVDNTERFESLSKFWTLCALNPNSQARQDLFSFLQGGRFTITTNGLFVAYRNVAIKQEGEDRELAEFVSTCVIKAKARKKAKNNFDIYKDSEGYHMYNTKKRKTTPEGELIGNLKDLAGQTFVHRTIYTDNYTKTFEITIGEPVCMDRSECDSNSASACSRGLHVGNKSFLTRGAFGQVGLVCLINPYNVVAVPKYDQNKLRCCEYLPIGIVEYDSNSNLIEIDTDLYEDDYCQFTVDQINEMLYEADMVEQQINTLFEDTVPVEYIADLARKAVAGRNVYISYSDEKE